MLHAMPDFSMHAKPTVVNAVGNNAHNVS